MGAHRGVLELELHSFWHRRTKDGEYEGAIKTLVGWSKKLKGVGGYNSGDNGGETIFEDIMTTGIWKRYTGSLKKTKLDKFKENYTYT